MQNSLKSALKKNTFFTAIFLFEKENFRNL